MPPRDRPAAKKKAAAVITTAAKTKAKPPARSVGRLTRGRQAKKVEEEEDESREEDENVEEAEGEQEEGEGEPMIDQQPAVNAEADPFALPSVDPPTHLSLAKGRKKPSASSSSTDEDRLLSLVDSMENWKNSSKESPLKLLRDVASFLVDYRKSNSSSTPLNTEIPPSHRPLLKSLAKSLVQKSILTAKQEEVRLLAACCLSDILRVFAPNHPYDSNEIKAIFQCFSQELQGLTRQSSLFDRYFFLIENLAHVQSPVLLCQLESQTPLIQFIHSLLSLLEPPFNNPRVGHYIFDILSSILNELNIDELSTPLIDALLVYLTPEKAQPNPVAAQIVVRLIDKYQDKLERVICKWIRDVVIEPAKRLEEGERGRRGKGKRKGEEGDSDVEDVNYDDEERLETSIIRRSDQLAIFKQLHLEVPSILFTLQHELPDLLSVDIEGTRKLFTSIYCDIFCAKPAIIKHFIIVYEILLKRFQDVAVSVRAAIAEKCDELLIRVYGGGVTTVITDEDIERLDKEDGVTSGVIFGLPHSESTSLEAVQEHLYNALQDKDDGVRQLTVHSLAKATTFNAALCNQQLLQMMGKRCMDRKHDVRKEGIIALADIFHHHLTPFWRKALSVPPSSRKFTFIPRTLLASCAVDTSNALFVELAMDNSLIGLKKDEVNGMEERTTCLLAIFSTLEEKSKGSDVEPHVGLPLLHYSREEETAKALFLNKFIVQKSSLHKGVQDAISIQQQLVSASQRGEDLSLLRRTQQMRLQAIATRLLFDEDAQFFTQHGAGAHAAAREEAMRYIQEVLYGLFTHDDPNVTEQLQKLSDCRTPLKDIRSSHHVLLDLIERRGMKIGGKKGVKGPTAKSITHRLACFCSQAVTPIDSVPHLFSAISSTNPNTSTAALDLLSSIAESWPLMLSSSVDQLYSLIQTQDDESKVVAALRILSSIDFSSTNPKHSLLNRLEILLRDLAVSGNRDVVRVAIRSIKAVFTEHTGGTVKLVNKLKLNVDLEDDVREDKADSILHALFTHYKEHLHMQDPNLEAVIVGLGECSTYYPRLFLVSRDILSGFFFKQLFATKAEAFHGAQLSAVECMTVFLGSLALTENTTVTMDVGKRLIAFFIKGVIQKGVLSQTASMPATPASSRRNEREERQEEEKRMEEEQKDGVEDGEEMEEKEEEAQRQDEILLALAKGLIDLCTHPPYHRFLFHVPNTSSAPVTKKSFHFAHLAFVAESASDRVRLPFLDHVITHLQASRLPFAYSAILCLAATMDEHAELKSRLKTHLINLIQRNRRRAMLAETVREERLEREQAETAERGGKKRVNPALPELVLADLIYLLSYHPSFIDPLDSLLPNQATEGDRQRAYAMYNYFLLYLDFFLDCVTADKADGNYSLLLAICSTIKNCEDVRDAENTKIYKLADLVQLSVSRRSQHKEWKSSISTIVTLPISLYKPRDTPPKERYLPKGYTLPEGKSEKHEKHTEKGPTTPRKRKGDEVAETPTSRRRTGGKGGIVSPTSTGRKEKKAKVEKEAVTPSRQMPSRLVKSVATYDEEVEEEEDDEEDIIIMKPKISSVSPKQTAASPRPSAGAKGNGETIGHAVNGGRVLTLGKNGKLQGKSPQKKQQKMEVEEEEEEKEEEVEEKEQQEEDAEGEGEEEEVVPAMKTRRANGRASSRQSTRAASAGKYTPASARKATRAGG